MPLRLALLFDSSLSIKNRLDFEKRAASRFFTYIMRSGDRVALVSVSSVWRVEQPLTGSAGALVDSLNRLKAEGITSLYSAVMGSSRDLGENEGRRVIVLLSGVSVLARITARRRPLLIPRTGGMGYPRGAGASPQPSAP